MSGFTKVCATVATAASFVASGMARAETPSEGCGTAAPVSGIYQTDVGGLTRTWRMQIPSGLDAAKPAPLALIFHGWGEDENAFLDKAIVTAEADRLGFVLVVFAIS